MSSMYTFFVPDESTVEEVVSMMSASVISDSIVMAASSTDPHTAAAVAVEESDVEFAQCECCGHKDEYTVAYIERIRERYHGKWICGLCAEAVKDEIVRSDRLISTEAALSLHLNFCNKVRSKEPPPDPVRHLIATFRQILRKNLDSPKSLRSMPCSPTMRATKRVPFARSESCIPRLNLVDSTEGFEGVDVEGDSQ